MKCKAERPWLPFANLWGLFLSSSADAFVLLSVCLSCNAMPFFFPSRYHSLPPSTYDSFSHSLGDNNLPIFFPPSKSWTLHFSDVHLQGINPASLFLIRWKTPVVIKHILSCTCVCPEASMSPCALWRTLDLSAFVASQIIEKGKWQRSDI